MSYRIRVAETGKYLVVVVEGPITVDLARRYSVEARDVSQANGIQRFLFDVRNARNVLSTSANYEFANKDADQMQLERSVRSAILAAPDDYSHDFVETTMRNAGYGVRLFRDEAAAIGWLEE